MTEQEKVVEVLNNLKCAGKHLAVKLNEVYKAAGIKNIHECQAIRDWFEALEATDKYK